MRGNRFTIYDALEKNGYFDKNSANTYSRDPTTGESLYSGPVEFPKALYHPDGEERITVPAELIMTPMGAKAVGEQREMIFQIVKTKAEEDAARAEGWLDHPAKAVRRRVELFIENTPAISDKEKAKLLASIPSVSSSTRIQELERELARLTGGTSPLLPEGVAQSGEIPANPTSSAGTISATSGPLQPVAKAAAMGANFGGKPVPAPAPAQPPA